MGWKGGQTKYETEAMIRPERGCCYTGTRLFENEVSGGLLAARGLNNRQKATPWPKRARILLSDWLNQQNNKRIILVQKWRLGAPAVFYWNFRNIYAKWRPRAWPLKWAEYCSLIGWILLKTKEIYFGPEYRQKAAGENLQLFESILQIIPNLRPRAAAPKWVEILLSDWLNPPQNERIKFSV